MSKKKKVVIGAVVGIAAIVGVATMTGNSKTEQVAMIGVQNAQVVQVAKASVEDIQSEVSATGMIMADNTEIVFSETTSIVHRVVKDVGDEVKAGDVIVELDPGAKERMERELAQLDIQIQNANIALEQLQGSGSKAEIMQAESAVLSATKAIEDLNNGISSAKANLEVAEADLASTENMYNVTKELFDQGLSSQKELDDMEKAYQMAQENVNQLRNSITSLEKDVENATLQQELAQYNLDLLQNKVTDQNKSDAITMRKNEVEALNLQRETLVNEIEKADVAIVAPMDGVISEISVTEGAPISTGMPIATIIDDTRLIVKSEISTFYAPQLHTGLDARIRYNGVETVEVDGEVTMVAPTATQSASATGGVNSGIPVEIELVGDTSKLKPGLLVDVRLTTERADGVVAVPLLATIADDEGEEYILVVKEDNTIEKRYVTRGVANNYVIAVDNIEEGEVVITNPTRALEEGMDVRYRDFD